MQRLERGLYVGRWTQTVKVLPPAHVSPGQSVDAGALLGEKLARGPLHLVDVASALGIEPQQLASFVRVSPDDRVQRGQTIAARRIALRQRIIYAPCAGTVQGLVAGCVLIRETARQQPQRATLAGRVQSVGSDGLITIEISGTCLPCSWASGPHRAGLLVIASGPDEELRWQHIGRHLAGAVLVGGRLCDRRALRRARQFGLSGLLVGSVNVQLSRSKPLPITVLASEGLGSAPMSPLFHETLTALAGRTILLAAENDQGAMAAVAHALPSQKRADEREGWHVGARVRLIRTPYLGQSGEIVDIPTRARRTALGTLAQGALVALSSGQRVFVPWTNLERLA